LNKITETEDSWKPVKDSSGQRIRHTWLELIAGLVTVGIAVFWLIFLIDRVVMPLITIAGVEHRIPDLHFLTFSEADSICRGLDLELIPGRTRIENRLDPGTILDQFPVAGVSVKPGRRIEVVISDRERMVECPNVVGRSPREAAITAASKGLTVETERIRYRHSRKYPEGVVMIQDPDYKTMLHRDDELRLVVSLGVKPTEIVAPNLVGRKLEGVNIILAKYNLRLGRIRRFPDRSLSSGTIMSQDPQAGTAMKSGQKVSVRVAIAPVSNLKPGTSGERQETGSEETE